MIVTGILSGGAICKRLCTVQNINFYDFIIIAAVILAFGFTGAKLLYLIDFYTPRLFFKAFFKMLTHPVQSGLMSGGFVFYGGLLGGIAGYFVGVKLAKTGVFTFLSTFAFVIPYVHAFGRIGCFCAGCCYGIPYEGPLCVHYTAPASDAPLNTGLFPVQLLEALLLFIFAFTVLALILNKTQDAPAHPIFIFYIIYYSVLRFFLEFLRYDSARGIYLKLSISQWISLLLFTAGVVILLVHKLKSYKLQTGVPE